MSEKRSVTEGVFDIEMPVEGTRLLLESRVASGPRI